MSASGPSGPLVWSRTPTFYNGTPPFYQMGVLNSCFQNSSESSELKCAKNLFFSFFAVLNLLQNMTCGN